jgi:hypothetical protein
MQKLENVYGRLLEVLALADCALILSMTLMICADVFLRNVRVVPGMVGLEWANEVSEGMLYHGPGGRGLHSPGERGVGGAGGLRRPARLLARERAAWIGSHEHGARARATRAAV